MAEVWVADEGDAASVTALMVAFRNHIGRDWPSDDLVRATVDSLLRDPATEFLLAAPEGRDAPAGVCQLRYRLSVWTASDDCWLEDLYVREAARRGGLGQALVEAALAGAKQRGCRRIELDVNEDNGAALALYRACGFTLEPKPPGRTLFVGRALGEY